MAPIRIAVTATLALGGVAAHAQDDLIPVSYGTNWAAQAEHGGFYQAVADGTYEECGLDVTIVPGGPSVNNQALMLAGKIDFYMGSAGGAIDAVANDIPVVMVAAMFQKDPQVILAHPGKAETFEDLKDLTLLISDTSVPGFYQWMMEEYGFTMEQREPYTFNAAPFIVDENKAMQGYLSSEPYLIEKEAGWTPDVFLLADAGYDPYSTSIETMQSTVAERPEVVQCFVEGSIKGWYTYLHGDNSAANEMIMADNPDMTPDKIEYAVRRMNEEGIVDSGDTAELGIGAITDERMTAFYDSMVRSGVFEEGIDIGGAYTTEFVNKGVGMELKPAN